MSLSGNLGFVSLDEVLRLLIRSGQRGCVAVTGNGIDGRVFVTRGGITLATTSTDQGLETLFRKSQMVDPSQVASGNIDSNNQEVVDLIREITVESLYRLNLNGESFDVREGVEARYGSPRPFELEQVLEESRMRLEDWAEVSQVVSNLDARLAFLRDLGDREEVKIRRDAWKVLSEVGAGASVTQIAHELGTTEFWAARVVARLVQDDLLKAQPGQAGAAAGTQETYSEPVYQPEPVAEPVAPEPPVSEEPVWDQPEAIDEPTYEPEPEPEPEYEYAYGQEDGEEDAGTSEATEAPVGDYFQETPEEPEGSDDRTREAEEPAWRPESQIPGVGEDTAEVHQDDEETSEALDPNQSWWQEPEDEHAPADDEADDSEGEVEEDTEAFLEKVFSELDRSDDGEEEGYGLLRRRRLGAMRDIARDS